MTSQGLISLIALKRRSEHMFKCWCGYFPMERGIKVSEFLERKRGRLRGEARLNGVDEEGHVDEPQWCNMIN
jgi:hypothetical protein